PRQPVRACGQGGFDARARLPRSRRLTASGKRRSWRPPRSGVRDRLVAHNGEHVVAGHALAVLVGDLCIPANLTVSGGGPERLLLARESHFDTVPGLDGFGEPQTVD